MIHEQLFCLKVILIIRRTMLTVLEFVGVLWLDPQRPDQLDPPMSMASSLTCWMPALGGNGVG